MKLVFRVVLLIVAIIATPALSVKAATSAAISISADKSNVSSNETVTYRVTLKNNGDKDINGARVVTNIPQYIVPLATSPLAIANPQTRTLTWDKIKLPAGSQTTFSFRAQPANNIPVQSNATVLAQINSDGLHQSASVSTSLIGNKTTLSNTPPPKRPPVDASAKTGTGSLLFVSIAMLISGFIGLSWFITRYEQSH